MAGRPGAVRRRARAGLDRPRPDRHPAACGRWPRTPPSARSRCAPAARPPACSTAGRPWAPATAPATPARSSRSPPVRADAPHRRARRPVPDGRRPRRWTPGCPTAGSRSRSPRSGWPSPERTVRPGRRRRGHRPVRRRARRARARPSPAAPWSAGPPRWPSRRRARRSPCRDTLPADDAELAALLAGCPLTLVSLGQLSDAAAPGADATDDGTLPTAREAAVQPVDAAVGRLRTAADALPGRDAAAPAGHLRGQRRPAAAARGHGRRARA